MDQQLELIPPDALVPPSEPRKLAEVPDYRGYRLLYKEGEYIGLLPPRQRELDWVRRNEMRCNGYSERVIE